MLMSAFELEDGKIAIANIYSEWSEFAVRELRTLRLTVRLNFK